MAAYVLVGVLLGPTTGLVDSTEHLSLFFEVGVVLPFFLVGVDEIDISGFVKTIRRRLFIAALVAFAVPLAVGIPTVFYVLAYHIATSIALSGILALSSLGVAARVLSDLGHLKQPIGLEIFTVVVLVELSGLLLVGFMIEELEHTDHVNAFHPAQAGILVGQIAAFTVVARFLASRVFVPLVTKLRQFFAAPQLTFGLLLGGLFLVAVAAEQIGLHGSLGGASAGDVAFAPAAQSEIRSIARNSKRRAGVIRSPVLCVGGTAPERVLRQLARLDGRRGRWSVSGGQTRRLDAGAASG